MSFKTKALGLAAATALSITMVSGAMAANTGTTATLVDGGAACTASADTGQINFGTWTWENDAWTVQNNASSTLSVTVSNTQFDHPDCVITMGAGALTGTDHGRTIDSTNSTITFDSNGAAANEYTVSSPYAPVSIGATLNITDFTNLVPDEYTGAVTIGVANAGA
jgi:hypothetical protein